MLDELNINSHNMQNHYAKIHTYSVVVVHVYDHGNAPSANKYIFINNTFWN